MNEMKYCQDLFIVLEQRMSETGRKFQVVFSQLRVWWMSG